MRESFLTRVLVSVFMTMTVIAPGGLWLYGVAPPSFAKNVPLPPAIALVRGMSDLATTKAHLSDYIECTNNHWTGKWAIHGELIHGIDLSLVTYSRVDPEKKEATLRLPTPHIVSSKLDHERSEEIYVKAVAWFPYSDKKALRDAVWREADRKIERLGEDPSYGERAKTHAERVLTNLFAGTGWKVSFLWPEAPPVLTANP